MLALVCAALSAASCEDSGAATPPPAASGRVVAVAASGKQATESDLCDVLKPGPDAPSFSFPPLDGAAPPQGSSYRWINVWATWCPPCIEELPLITRWRDEDAFQAWVESPSFAEGHRSAVERSGGEAPKPVSTHSEVWSYEIAGGSQPG